MAKTKKPLINHGTPAPETPLGAVYHTAQGGLDGSPIEGVRDRQPLMSKGATKPRVSQSQDVVQFAQELSNFERLVLPIVRSPEDFNWRWRQIYEYLRELVDERAPVLLEGCEPWKAIKWRLDAIKHDPSLSLSTIQYTCEMLRAYRSNIEEFMNDPRSGLSINRPDLMTAHTPEDQKARKEQAHKDKAQAEVNAIKEDDGDAGIGL